MRHRLRAKQVFLVLNKNKVKLRQAEVTFMGLVNSKDGWKPDPEKVSVIKNITKPATKPEVRTTPTTTTTHFITHLLPYLVSSTTPLDSFRSFQMC